MATESGSGTKPPLHHSQEVVQGGGLNIFIALVKPAILNWRVSENRAKYICVWRYVCH